MRLGIDATLLRPRNAGTLRYTAQLIHALAGLEGLDLVVFAQQALLEAGELGLPACVSRRGLHTHPAWPAALGQQGYGGWHSAGHLDWLHTPGFVPPLAFRGRTVMTVFDLTFWRYAHAQKWSGRLWWRLLGRPGMRRASRLVAISQSTRSDVCAYLSLPPERVAVVYPYLPASFQPVADPRPLLRRYSLPQKYILYVGTLERRKNVVGLLKAFAAARREYHLEHILVLGGQAGWLYNEIFRTVEELGLAGQVTFLGYVPEADLPALYSGAELFAYLSRYEGFGLPVLEAMACGVPVLASNAASLPEVTGEAALLVAPEDIEAAAAYMGGVLTDRERHAELSRRGRQQAQCFSQERFTREMLAVYGEAALP